MELICWCLHWFLALGEQHVGVVGLWDGRGIWLSLGIGGAAALSPAAEEVPRAETDVAALLLLHLELVGVEGRAVDVGLHASAGHHPAVVADAASTAALAVAVVSTTVVAVVLAHRWRHVDGHVLLLRLLGYGVHGAWRAVQAAWSPVVVAQVQHVLQHEADSRRRRAALHDLLHYLDLRLQILICK
jgi:hypothetical protein